MIWTPEPHMQLMREFLFNRDRAALFASPGLSKTASTLAAINDDFLDGVDGRTLVVAPLRVARLTWPNEVAKWDDFKWMTCEVLRGQKPSGRAHISTINYERLHQLTDLSPWRRVVFDELTRAKNPQSERIAALRPLLGNRKRWGLTGTPRPNSLLEIFAQIRLLDDGKRLGPSFDHFRRAYFSATDYNEYNWVPKPGSEELIYRKIHDLVLTLRSSDYSDVPDTIVEDVTIALPKDAHAIYRQLERDLMALIGDDEVVAINAAVLVNKLLQVCGGAVYATEEGVTGRERQVVPIHSGKIAVLKRVLLDCEGGNVIVFTNFIHERERVVAALNAAQPGSATDAARFKGDIEDAWNSGRIKYLVADPRSLGHGLNLQQGGSTVIWYSPTWSRELYDQANARVARKGQDRQPRVYRIVCAGTMDEAVLETLRMRGDEQSAMLEVLTNFRKLGLCFF